MRTLVPGERAPAPNDLLLSIDRPVELPLALALIALDRDRLLAQIFPPVDTVRREMRPAARFDDAGALSLSWPRAALLTRVANATVSIAAIVHDELSAQAAHPGQSEVSGPEIALSPKRRRR